MRKEIETAAKTIRDALRMNAAGFHLAGENVEQLRRSAAALERLALHPEPSQGGTDWSKVGPELVKALRPLGEAYSKWRKAVDKHTALLQDESVEVTGRRVTDSGHRCASTYQRLTALTVEVLPNLLALTEPRQQEEGR